MSEANVSRLFGKAMAGPASRLSSVGARIAGASVRGKILGLAVVAALIPLPLLWWLGATGAQRASREAAVELDELGRQNVRQVSLNILHLCEATNALLQPRLDRGLAAAYQILAKSGGILPDEKTRVWSALDQESHGTAQVTLPGLLIGTKPLVENRDPQVPSPVVDEVMAQTGMWASLFQRMNDKGDMLRVASSILAADGKRGTGLFLPAVLSDGSPNPVLAAVLDGRTYHGTSQVAGRMYLAVYDPIRDRDGKVIAMFAVAYDWDILEKIRQTISATVVGRGGSVTVLGTRGASRGVYAVSRGRTRDGANVWDEKDSRGRFTVREQIARVRKARPGDVVFDRSLAMSQDRKTEWSKISALTYFEPWDWLIDAGTNESDFQGARARVDAAFSRLLRNAALAGTAVLLLAVGVALFLSGRLARPLVLLLGEADRLGRGDLRGAAAPPPLPTRSHDETRLLSHAFGSMAAAFASLVRQVQRSGIQVVSSTTQIAASARQLEDSVAHQTSATPQISASAREISSTARELSVTIDDVSSVASSTAARAADGRSALAQMDGSVRRISSASSSVSLRLAAISDIAHSISSLVTTITRVADQTNLLSLNAAIEAEKAGEQGRGFAVVAREIRRLADQTAVATLDIERTVQGVLSAVSSGVLEMDRFVDEVRLATGDVERLSSLLSAIVTDVEGLDPRLDSVRSAARAQADAASQISDAMSLLDRSASSSKGTLADFHAATLSLQDAVASLRAEVARIQVDP